LTLVVQEAAAKGPAGKAPDNKQSKERVLYTNMSQYEPYPTQEAAVYGQGPWCTLWSMGVNPLWRLCFGRSYSNNFGGAGSS